MYNIYRRIHRELYHNNKYLLSSNLIVVGSGNNVLTEASVIGLSVAIVGLFAILVVVIIMVTCARKKIDRARANRTSTHGLQDTTGPYGGYFVGQTMPEPPPRYSSQPDLSVHSVSSTSFTPFPLCNVPPPQYSPYEKPPPRPSPNEPPPTYSSYPDLNTALVETSMHSDAGMTGFDNPALDTEERSTPIQYNSYKESSQRNLKAQPNLRSASSSGLSQGPEKPRVNSALNLSHDDPEKAKLEATAYGGARKNSAESLYAGLTEADRSLLQNIMLTVPSEVLQRADSTEQLDLIKPRKMPAKSDHWASEPAILETRHRAQPFHGSKSYGQLDELEELPPLRHSYSQHSQLLSSSDSAQQHQVTPLDFHSSQPLCISTPKQTSPRRLQLFPSTYNIDPDTEGSDNETKEDYLKASAC